MKTTYLLYVEGGKASKHEGKDFKQFYVQRELELIGVEGWCGRRLEFIRKGKKRHYEKFESPFLPNYMFAEMTPEQFNLSKKIKYLGDSFMTLCEKEVLGIPGRPGLNQFKRAVDTEYEAAQKVDANSRAAVTEYKRGQRMQVLSGPFAEMFASFERVVNSPDVPWPRIEAVVDGLGARVMFDPLDIREMV